MPIEHLPYNSGLPSAKVNEIIDAVNNAAPTDAYAEFQEDVYVEGTFEVIGNSDFWGSVSVGGSPLYVPKRHAVPTLQTTTSNTYTDLATVGPTVTLTTGSLVMVTFGCSLRRTAGASSTTIGYAVSGATTIAPGDTTVTSTIDSSAQSSISVSTGTLAFKSLCTVVKVTPGSNTFTCKYQAGSATTGEFSNRFIMVERID